MRAAGYRHAHNYIGRKISFERKKSAPAYNRTCFPTQMVFLRAEGRGRSFFGVFKLFSSWEEMRGWARDGRWRGNSILTTQFVPSGDSRFRWANDGCEDPNASAGWSGDVDAGNPYPRVSIAFLFWLGFFQPTH